VVASVEADNRGFDIISRLPHPEDPKTAVKVRFIEVKGRSHTGDIAVTAIPVPEKLPPVKSSRASAATATFPPGAPLAPTVTTPPSTSTVPVLLNATLTLVVPPPPDFRNVPTVSKAHIRSRLN